MLVKVKGTHAAQCTGPGEGGKNTGNGSGGGGNALIRKKMLLSGQLKEEQTELMITTRSSLDQARSHLLTEHNQNE